MSKISAAITAVGAYVPEYVLTNQILETMVDTNDEWITSRTGIKERRILKEEGKGTSFLAINAAQDLINKRGIDPKDIELVIVATATPDMKAASTQMHFHLIWKLLVQVFCLVCLQPQSILNLAAIKMYF
jgi:3-oxoacyl-[acyl-carrier-protein] synthase-3